MAPYIFDEPLQEKEYGEEEARAMETWKNFAKIVGGEMGLKWSLGVVITNFLFSYKKIEGRWHGKGFSAEFSSIQEFVSGHLGMMEILNSPIFIYISEKYRGSLSEFSKAVAKAENATRKDAYITIRK